MNILAIDTSTDACSCALWLAGEIIERFILAPRRHGELILKMIAELCATTELKLSALDALAFGCGPGSFTGLRISAGVIQGLAFALELPVALISSLAGLAQGVKNDRVLVIQDARMGEVYCGAFRRGPDLLMQAITNEKICRPELITIPDETGAWIGVGNAWNIYPISLANKVTILPEMFPRARDIAILAAAELAAGMGVSAELALPRYLRGQIPA